MSTFRDAMKELKVADSATPKEKFRAVCQWELGHPGWADQILAWLRGSGYEVKEK